MIVNSSDTKLAKYSPDAAVTITLEDCNTSDIQFLEDLISVNSLDENSSYTDTDNGNGVLEPLELGRQLWIDGRLHYIETTWVEYYSFEPHFFNYEINIIPESVQNQDVAEYLIFAVSYVQSIPESLG